MYSVDGTVLYSGKEVWVDDFPTIEAAIAAGDIINFTAGKTYHVDHSIVVNKACYINGNGCTLDAEPKAPDTSSATSRGYYYIFNVTHDNIVLENFNAVSENLYAWQNGSIVYPNTITSNVYFSRISASNVLIANISTNHLCGAVRIADDANSEAFSYHDIRIDNITCLDGTMNIYVGNAIRCVISNITLSTNVHNDTLGHAVYISRGVKHLSLNNFTIYNNYGVYGGISIHPSDSTDPSLTSYITISNGTIYTAASDSFAFQITDAENITVNNVLLECVSGAHSISFSQEVNNVVFNGCVLKGSDLVLRSVLHDEQYKISFIGCVFDCTVSQSEFNVLKDIQGMSFNSCLFHIKNETGNQLNGYLIGSKYMTTAISHEIVMQGCTIIIYSGTALHLLKDTANVVNDFIAANCVFKTVDRVASLVDSGVTHSNMVLRNIEAINYDTVQ